MQDDVSGGWTDEGSVSIATWSASMVCVVPSATARGFRDHPQAFANGYVRWVRCLQVLYRLCVLT